MKNGRHLCLKLDGDNGVIFWKNLRWKPTNFLFILNANVEESRQNGTIIFV